ncbi:glycosyltransferase [Pseudoalteromonas piscicida]|uniref:MJ1255/VC2487 family glycosyltransferase n=1 Tax=Pseudoalteromonas piscicida TaxID=43662 RepID=UPI001EFD266B|nr:MJ1255/VC2487 family glycosyltransferase [Pseudoalteromonas piscicida]MCG9769331.1 glycosyltransferase [Pseudoalteromonas piscicida]
MKILYGVQGTGNGHTTRARVMANCFRNMGISVDYFFSGRPSENYFDMHDFGDYRSCRGLSFVTERGQLNRIKTFQSLKFGEFIRDVRKLDVSGYDLIFNDFEPVSAWAGKLAKVPVIAMSHQASYLYDAVPQFAVQPWHKALIRYFAPADIHLGVHWQPFDKHIIPPFIPYEAEQEQCASIINKVLVYLPFEALDSIIELLKDFPDKEFYCYHPDADNASLQHIHLRKPSRSGFIQDLRNTSGVIANAGFELSSEALKLGKKLLLKPLDGQFEQQNNAQTLAELGHAQVMNYLNAGALEEWLQTDAKASFYFPSDPSLLVEWLMGGQWHNIDLLHNQLWNGVNHLYVKAA